MDSYQVTNSSQSFLNLGSGYQPLNPPWINVDYKEAPRVDQIVDLNGPWPWKDNSVDQIFSSHVIEHLNDFVHFMRECQRILKVGGYLELQCPHGWSEGAMGDPYHKRPFFEGTFASFIKGYGTQDNPRQTMNPQYDEWPFTFEVILYELDFSPWVKKYPFWKKWGPWLSRRLVNVATNIRIIYQKT
jgi:SAM-dependent methyltransferase